MITCRSRSEIDKLRRVNQLVARILAELRATVAPGVTTPVTWPERRSKRSTAVCSPGGRSSAITIRGAASTARATDRVGRGGVLEDDALATPPPNALDQCLLVDLTAMLPDGEDPFRLEADDQ